MMDPNRESTVTLTGVAAHFTAPQLENLVVTAGHYAAGDSDGVTEEGAALAMRAYALWSESE